MNQEMKVWVLISHLGAIVFSFVAPLFVWLLQHEESDEIEEHARASLNFQLTVFVGYLGAYLLTFIWIGYPILYLLMLFNAVCVIMASVKAWNDEELFRYPFAYEFFQQR